MDYEIYWSLSQGSFVTFQSLFGERLKQARKALGWSQADAAEIAGVSREYWGRCERGASIPGGEVLAALAQKGVDVNSLLTGAHSNDHAAHDAAEQVLLDSYRRCNASARQHLIQTAALLAAGLPASAPAGSGMHMSNLGDGNVQVGGSMSGSVRVRRGK